MDAGTKGSIFASIVTLLAIAYLITF